MKSFENRSAAYFSYVSSGSAERLYLQNAQLLKWNDYMSKKQNQDKLDKRAAALRENLKKRKPPKKKDEKNDHAKGT